LSSCLDGESFSLLVGIQIFFILFFNPFTAPAYKISGLKYTRMCLQTVYFPIFSAVRFDENPFTCQCENEDKKAKGFQISYFYWSFLSYIMAVKGLRKRAYQSCISELE